MHYGNTLILPTHSLVSYVVFVETGLDCVFGPQWTQWLFLNVPYDYKREIPAPKELPCCCDLTYVTWSLFISPERCERGQKVSQLCLNGDKQAETATMKNAAQVGAEEKKVLHALLQQRYM